MLPEKPPPGDRARGQLVARTPKHRSKQAPSDLVVRIALLVDDDPFFRMALRTILTDRLGCAEIIEAASSARGSRAAC